MKIVASGLEFPEGPIAVDDGSVLVVEIAAGRLSRISADGTVSTVVDLGGGPNGAAIGPDGKCYICNNGGFAWHRNGGGLRPIGQAEDYSGGRIERVDLTSGAVEVLYTHADGIPLKGPNDIVFDHHGGFWFSDIGKSRAAERDHGAVFYARCDGSSIKRVIFPMVTPNGVGLSPNGATLYVAETLTGRLWAFDIVAPGEIQRHPWPSPHGGRFLAGFSDYRQLDSMAIEECGNICVASIMTGGIVTVSPDGRVVEIRALDDIYTTNICFGGSDLRTAYVTLSASGQLAMLDWDRPGLELVGQRAGFAGRAIP